MLPDAGMRVNRRILIVTNLVAIVSALVFRWPISYLLFPYWIQSVIIGYYSRKRMLSLNHFSTEGFRSNGQQVDPTEETKRDTARFFTFHYGFFHAVYLAVLSSLVADFETQDWVWMLILALSFIHGHSSMYRANYEADRSGCPNIGLLMFLPYVRIIPMHLIIFIGMLSSYANEMNSLYQAFVVIVFGSFKTGADYLMAVVEHKYVREMAESKVTEQSGLSSQSDLPFQYTGLPGIDENTDRHKWM